jgi:HSP20 family protein
MPKEEKGNKTARKRAQHQQGLVPFGLGFGIDPTRINDFALGYPSRILERMQVGLSMPKVDIIDNGESFTVVADLPDVDKKDIKITITNSSITIQSNKTAEKETRDKNFYSKERSSIGYYRTIGLPEEVRKEGAKARYENGTLRIEVKKLKPKEESAEVRVD